MAFGICRIRNLKLGDISSTDLHNARRYESIESYPKNIQPEGESFTRYLAGNDGDFIYKEEITLAEALDYRMKENNVVGQRKDSNVAIEYVLAVNDQAAWENYKPKEYFAECLDWLEKRHGEGSVISMHEHYDETNPHAHFIVVPLITKEVKWKNRNGEGVKKETRTDVRSWTGGPGKLRTLQDDYHTFVKGFEEKMGVEFFRGTLVENQTREYIQQTDHRADILKADIEKLNRNSPSMIDKVLEQLKILNRDLISLAWVRQILNKALADETQRRKEQNKQSYWKKKGIIKDFKKGDDHEYFHTKNPPVPPSPKKDENQKKNRDQGNQFSM